MLLAELELHHSRPVAPTRRLALGRRLLPADPPPGFGGLLLAAVVARFARELDPDALPEVARLVDELAEGRRIPQPRLRHRLQSDRIGLVRSVHRLWGRGDELRLDLAEDRGVAAQHVLGAVYAAGELERRSRRRVMAALGRALAWTGPVDGAFLAHLAGPAGADTAALADPVAWARTVLGLGGAGSLDRGVVQRRFRRLVRDAHPDHGGDGAVAASRLAELTEARRLLLAVCAGPAPGRTLS